MTQKIYNQLVSSDCTKAELKQALSAAEQLLEGELGEAELIQLSQALSFRFACEYDGVRQTALDLYLKHIGRFAEVQLQQSFYSVYKCLNTGNLRYDGVVRSETSRKTMLTILLKLLVYVEKLGKERQIAILQQQQQPITDILVRQIPDPCPENRMQCCKCVYRFAKGCQHLLTEEQISAISEELVQHFNHQRSQIRELMLQAFVQLHLCVQSKEIFRYWNPILNFMLNDEKAQEPMLEAAKTLITQHIDRHVFADIFVLPFIANLQDPAVLAQFEEIGEFYANENRKFDKFLQLQRELETTNEEALKVAQRYDGFIAEFNQRYYKGSAFTRQLNTGCRILGQICLQKNQKAILADMRQVNSAQTKKLSQLMSNLMLLCERHCLTFSADLLQNLGVMIHDTFHAAEYEKVIHLIGKFVAPADIVGLIKAQLLGVQSVLSLTRLYDFSLKYLEYAEMSDAEGDQLFELLLTENANCIEDARFIVLYSQIQLTLSTRPLSSRAVNQVAVAMASCVQRLALIASGNAKAVKELLSEYDPQMDLEALQRRFSDFLSAQSERMDLELLFELIGLARDYMATKNLLLKIQTFTRLLLLTSGTGFHQKHITVLIKMGMKLLKAAQNFEKIDRQTRQEAIVCVELLLGNLNMEDQQRSFFLEHLFPASTWKHGARSPECLDAALHAISVVLQKMKGKLSADELDTIHQKICVNLESDVLQIRLAALNLCRAFLEHMTLREDVAGYEFKDLPWDLIQRLDDAKTEVTLQALDMFSTLMSHVGRIESNRTNICLLLVTHLNDEVAQIRQKCSGIIEAFRAVLGEEELREQSAGKVFEWVDINRLLPGSHE